MRVALTGRSINSIRHEPNTALDMAIGCMLPLSTAAAYCVGFFKDESLELLVQHVIAQLRNERPTAA